MNEYALQTKQNKKNAASYVRGKMLKVFISTETGIDR